MVEKKLKKVKKGDKNGDARPAAPKVVDMEDMTAPRPKPEDYGAMKKRYLELKKRYAELEAAFNRISTLEDDIKKVHQKLDHIDANSANVEKDLAVVKNRVASVSKDMKAITVVARNISTKYGFDIKVADTPERPTAPARPPAGPQPKPVAAPPKQPAQAQGQRRPSPVFTRAAKALAFAQQAEMGKAVSDEITAQPQRGKPVGPKDHRDASERMDDVVVSGDDDTDTVDYLVKPEGKTVPLDKKTVKKELEENEKKQ